MSEPIKSDEKFIEIKRALQAFQQHRIQSTYADMTGDPANAKIAKFFFEKLYAPEDFSFRDTSIRKLRKVLKGAVYKGMASAVDLVIELHELSDALDNLMVEKMIENSMGSNLTMAGYQAIYCQLDNYDQRVYQIQLISRSTRAFHRLSRMWIVSISLKTVRSAAHLLGMGEIIDFIHEGYVAFRAIDHIDPFVDMIEQRELAWHDHIWNSQHLKPVRE